VADYAHAFEPAFQLDGRRTALLVVDMQYATASRLHGLGRLLADQGRAIDGAYRFSRIEDVVVPGVSRLLAAFRTHRLPVLYASLGSERDDYSDVAPHLRELACATGNTRGRLEREILEDLAPRASDPVIDKTTACAFIGTRLEDTLQALDVTHIVVCGVSTNTCVDSTARHAADLGYRVLIVEDGTAAASEELHLAALASFARIFGRVARVAEVCVELDD
jgi:nicotinamidase-related amidase